MMHKLEKLNSSIDIIPLQQTMDGNSKRLGPGVSGIVSIASTNKTFDRQRPVEAQSRDPLLISRVKQYLYAHENEVYVCVDRMSDELQSTYRDYRNKKRAPFRAMVRRAYDEITENLTRQVDSQWQDDDDEIDIEVDSMPSEYMQAYKRQAEMTGRQNGNSSDKELIDISSDDDQPKNQPSHKENDRDYIDIDMQVTKRPHLSPTIERSNRISLQAQQMGLNLQQRNNRSEKSRKRPREKENDTPFEPLLKKKSKDLSIVKSAIKFSDIGGTEKVLETIVNLLLHLKHPEVYKNLGISPPRGFLLHGPPGCGKTLLAHAISGELNLPLLKVAAPELVSGVSGESEQRIRDLFEQAVAIAPCIVFIDEIDAIVTDRATSQRGMEKRIVSQLLLCMDELNLKDNGNRVLVLGATNRPESLDPALRRAGRFDREVSLGIPDKSARVAILKIHTSKVKLSPEIDLQNIAALTPGYVGADLVALVREAVMIAVNRALHNLKNTSITPEKKDEVAATNEVIVEEETEKPKEVNVSDVIIEDDEEPAAKDDVDEVIEEKETEDELATSTTEEPKKAEETSESLQTSDNIAADKTFPTSTDEVKSAEDETANEATEKVEPPLPDERTTSENKPAVSAVTTEAVAVEAENVPPVTSEPATVAIEVINEAVQDKREGHKLTDLLSWLHDVPPLTPKQLAVICVEQRDFDAAIKVVQPSAKREGFATVPDVTWDDIGSLQDIRQELQMTILAPVRYAEQFASLGLAAPSGVLLCGPPGCGKTLLAKAIANEAGINFISVKGPELMNMYVGESERAVRQCFSRARNSAPCVIFFDELDALCPKRSENDNSSTSRVVNQMLTEMDGIEGRKNVFLMAASNRPDIIDPAVLRPGRLDKILYVGLPSPDDRADILRALTKNGTKPKLSLDVNLEEVANEYKCNGYTGADLAALVNEAGIEVLREIISGLTTIPEICLRHIYAALEKVRPSVQEKDLQRYETLRNLYSVRKSQNTDVQMSLDPPIDVMEAMET